MEPLLLVEDKNELRAMLRKALERAGYAVDEASDGATAIQKVRARRYLMVITDLKMITFFPTSCTIPGDARFSHR